MWPRPINHTIIARPRLLVALARDCLMNAPLRRRL